MYRTLILAGMLVLAPITGAVAQDAGPTDAQIAHIAYAAGQIDIEAARQALEKSTNPEVRAFAELMARDHAAVNDQAVALVTRLHVTPTANSTSAALTEAARTTRDRLQTLDGEAFDAAYVANEVAYHRTVNTALSGTLIPQADNADLKALLEVGLSLFQSHQAHAEQLVRSVR